MTIRKTITLTDKQDNWIKERIASGDYTNDSEYFRDLIRRDQEQNGRFQALKSAMQAAERPERSPFRPRRVQGLSLSDAVIEGRR